MSPDKLPPHSESAEAGVLGCLMLSPNDCIGECVEKFKAGEEVFYDLKHREIFKVMLAMWEKKDAIDLITLQQRLKDHNQLENVGGLAYLSSLPDAVPSAANLSYYAEIVFEKYVLRKMIRTCSDVITRATNHQGEVDELMDEVEHDILKIRDIRTSKEQSHKAACVEAVNQIEKEFTNPNTINGLTTGFPDLDHMTNGLQAPDMIIIAARPSFGKTSMALNIAEHVAVNNKIPVGVFSLEMSTVSLLKRMMFCRAKVDSRAMREKKVSQEDFMRLSVANKQIADAPLFIDDTAGLGIVELRAKARRMHAEHGIKLFIIDYLQLMNARSLKPTNREHEVALISGGIKALLKELGVPGIVVAQLNRDIEKSKSKKTGESRTPCLADLRESGSIEQDGDIIGFLYRANRKATQPFVEPVNLLIAKQRNGPTGDIPFTFFKQFTRFESSTHENFDQTD